MTPEPQLSTRRDVLVLADGRRLEWSAVGPREAPVLLYHHGTPSGSLPARFMARAVVGRGLQLVTPARAGYGRSDRHPGRDVAAAAADARALLDELAVDAAYVAGWSGGGPHALACGALLGDRVRAVAVIAGVAPYGRSDLDFMDGMGEDNLVEFGLALQGEPVLRPWLEEARQHLVGGSGEDLRVALKSLLAPVDQLALTGEFADDMVATTDDGLAGGVDGWLDDDLAFTAGWGFELADLAEARVDVWQGTRDLMVPAAHGEWLARHIPGARPHLLAQDGHLSVAVGRIEEVLDRLLEPAGSG